MGQGFLRHRWLPVCTVLRSKAHSAFQERLAATDPAPLPFSDLWPLEERSSEILVSLLEASGAALHCQHWPGSQSSALQGRFPPSLWRPVVAATCTSISPPCFLNVLLGGRPSVHWVRPAVWMDKVGPILGGPRSVTEGCHERQWLDGSCPGMGGHGARGPLTLSCGKTKRVAWGWGLWADTERGQNTWDTQRPGVLPFLIFDGPDSHPVPRSRRRQLCLETDCLATRPEAQLALIVWMFPLRNYSAQFAHPGVTETLGEWKGFLW